MGQLPRWLVVLFASVLTLITGAECTALLMHGWFRVDDPNALRDGQYMFVFFLGGSAGTAAAIPTAVMGAVIVARHPGFVLYLTVTLALITALGVGMGLLLSVPAGINGVGWGVLYQSQGQSLQLPPSFRFPPLREGNLTARPFGSPCVQGEP